MWDPSSPTRDQIPAAALKMHGLIHWIAREEPLPNAWPRMTYKSQLPSLTLGLKFLWDLYIYKIKFGCSLINLSYVNLIIRPAKEPRMEEGKNCLPLEH